MTHGKTTPSLPTRSWFDVWVVRVWAFLFNLASSNDKLLEMIKFYLPNLLGVFSSYFFSKKFGF